MISDHQKFRVPDLNGKNHITAEVNWDEKDPATNQCKVIRMTTEGGEKLYVKREDLNQILFAIGDPDSQKQLIPQTLETVHWRETVLGIRAIKDIKKGEMINFPIKISFPCTNTREVIGEKAWNKEVAYQSKRDIWTPSGFVPSKPKS